MSDTDQRTQELELELGLMVSVFDHELRKIQYAAASLAKCLDSARQLLEDK